MNEHEKLKVICDTIGFDSNFIFKDKEYHYRYGSCCTRADVREVIFFPDFMEKFINHLYSVKIIFNCELLYNEDDINKDLMNNLVDPVEYLYNTLKLGK